MVTALIIGLLLLGLAAVDPVGIAAMPILLLQPHPYRRSVAFLSGSFAALVLTGSILTRGLGGLLLAFEVSHAWLQPALEGAAGVILCVTGSVLLFRHLRRRSSGNTLSGRMTTWLTLSWWQLCLGGALLVTVQSLADVVFVIAMIRVGQAHISEAFDLVAISSYAIGALALQGVVVLAYALTPPRLKPAMLSTVRTLLARYADRVIIVTSFMLGIVLLTAALWPLVR